MVTYPRCRHSPDSQCAGEESCVCLLLRRTLPSPVKRVTPAPRELVLRWFLQEFLKVRGMLDGVAEHKQCLQQNVTYLEINTIVRSTCRLSSFREDEGAL